MWAGNGRSTESYERAEQAGMVDVGSIESLASQCEIIISVCPPSLAEETATAISAYGFTGVYVDANAVSPSTARTIGAKFDRFVDGGIVGPPVQHPGTTRLYLAGGEAGGVADLFKGSNLDVRIVAGEIGAASALKMSFAAWTKGTAALLLSIRALAEAEGVTDALISEWEVSMPHLIGQSEGTAAAIAPKAWRFAGEMHEIADTFEVAGLPDGFHRAAAEVYERLADLRTAADPTLADVVDRLSK